MARVLVGVSGGIAAYKAVELVRLAMRAGHSVRVLATPASERFVGAATFEGITGAPVLVSEFDPDPLAGAYPGESATGHLPISHLELAAGAEAMVVAPASAGTLAKLAGGFCDSALTTAFLACDAPRLVAPAMNDRMYADAATQENVARLRERGVTVIDPEAGDLASRGEYGLGRMAEPPALLEAVERSIAAHGGASGSGAEGPLAGRRVLVTAGGTREPLDPVRYLGNRSSGRMGWALAEAARDRGAEVTVVAANVALDPPAGVRVVRVETTSQLAEACSGEFPGADLLLMAAAPADFRPASPAGEKITRSSGELSLDLVATDDVLAELASRRRPGQVLVGFAAETSADRIERSRGKLEAKGLDMVVCNDVSGTETGFDSERNAVTLVTPSGSREVSARPKREVAEAVLEAAAELG